MAFRNAVQAPLSCPCGVLHGSDGPNPTDNDGCVLAIGHAGPHEFVEPNGRRWLWETDMECDCEHCMLCEGDYCTTYWPKPAAAATA